MNIPQVLRGGFLGFRLRHLVIVVIILSFLAAGLVLYVTQSDAYAVAQNFARTQPIVLEKVGTVSEVRWKYLDGFHLTYSGSGGDATFVFAVVGNKEQVTLDIRMKRVANSWTVETAYMKTASGKPMVIRGT